MCVTTLGKMHFRIYQLLLRVLEEKKKQTKSTITNLLRYVFSSRFHFTVLNLFLKINFLSFHPSYVLDSFLLFSLAFVVAMFFSLLH